MRCSPLFILGPLFLFAIGLLPSATVGAEEPWIIDPHTHFKGEQQIAYEKTKTERDPRNTLGHVVVPEEYRAIADRLGIQSTLVVEAVDQDQLQFNDWIFKQASSDLVCGYIARADLSSTEFPAQHRRYKSTGYLNGYRFRMDELAGYLTDPLSMKHLAMLENESMVVDLLVEPKHAPNVAVLARRFPKLKVVINHCYRARLVSGKPSKEWIDAVNDSAQFANVFCKISSIINFAGSEPFDERAPSDLETYRPVLQTCYDAFGSDRVIFATNWGVCSHYGPVDDVVRIVKEFLDEKGPDAVKKGMRLNAIRIYGIQQAKLR